MKSQLDSFLLSFENSSRTILEKYLRPAVSLAEEQSSKICKRLVDRQSQTWFHLAHYADALFKSYEERLSSSEWQAALRLRKHKVSSTLVAQIHFLHVFSVVFCL